MAPMVAEVLPPLGTTNPGVCIPPSQPSGSLSIVNSTYRCMLTSGSISIGSVTGRRYWNSASMVALHGVLAFPPIYQPLFCCVQCFGKQWLQKFHLFCWLNMPGTCIPPAPPTGNLAIVNSSCTNCVLTPGSISLGNVSGSGEQLNIPPTEVWTGVQAYPLIKVHPWL